MTTLPPRASTTPITGRTVLIAAVVPLIAVLLFAAFSNQVWEDYYITYRSSRHLVEGHGLVYNVGERVHTFTSPLGVLLPALTYWITGSDTGALWLFRALSALALGGAAALAAMSLRDHKWPAAACWLLLALGFLEAKVIAFSSNGMETALLALFTTWTWRELTRPEGSRAGWLAVGFAGLMWTRPDAFVVAGAMSAGWWLFKPAANEASPWAAWLKAVLVGGALYAPWFAWAWWYYGSPVPHTILAKSAMAPEGLSLIRLLAAPLRCVVDRDTGLDAIFAPIYSNATGWPRDFINVTRLLARVAAILWLVPTLPRPARAASFAVLIGGVYLHQIMPYPWYFAPWTILAAVALTGAVITWTKASSGWQASLAAIAATVIAVGSVGTSVLQAQCCRVQQELIEDRGRKQIGLWLRDRVRPGETVFAEPIGYIGYFSQKPLLDYPGLTAPRVSELIRSGHRNYASLIAVLQPDWIVLRPLEVESQHLREHDSLANYAIAGHWNSAAELAAWKHLPGRGWLEFDSEFYVFKRQAKP